MPSIKITEQPSQDTFHDCPPEAICELVEHDENDAPRHPFLNRTQRVLLLLGGLFVGACLWQAYWHSGPQTGRIADIQVGQRVYSENPTGEEDLQFGRDINPATWKKITLKANKFDGATADVVLLRPDRWLEDRDAKVGGTVDLYLVEVGIFGPAEVLSIETCPEIATGDGQVVTGTFRHHSGDVYDLAIEGEEQPIGTTGNHPFWSEDRQDFIAAAELRPGERLSTPYGVTTVKGLTPRGPPEPVYNLEVAVNHTYHVGETGVLVHNAYPLKPINFPAPGSLRRLDLDDFRLPEGSTLAGSISRSGNDVLVRVENIVVPVSSRGQQSMAAVLVNLRKSAKAAGANKLTIEGVSVGNDRRAKILYGRHGANYTPQRTLMFDIPID